MADLSYSTLPVQGDTNDATDVITPLNEVKDYVNGSGWVDTARLKDANVTAAKLADAAKLGLDDGTSVRRGKSIIPTTETFTQTSYGYATTPDRVQNIVLPTDGLIHIGYLAQWKESVLGAARAAIFIGANQLMKANGAYGGPSVQEAALTSATGLYFASLSTSPGLGLQGTAAFTGDVGADATTGQVLSYGGNIGGVCTIFAAAGTYDVGIKFKSSSGSVSVRDRKLWVWTMGF